MTPTQSGGMIHSVLECAVNGHADMLVTDNERDFRRAVSFGVKVVTAPEFVQVVEAGRDII